MSEIQSQFSIDSLDLDGRVKRSEVKEIVNLWLLDQEKLQLTIETRDKLKTFLNTEYRWANENYMKPQKVSDMQSALNKKLWLQLTVDSMFWPATFQALVQFQKENGLVTDGLCGPKTQSILFESQKEQEVIIDSNDSTIQKNNFQKKNETNSINQEVSKTAWIKVDHLSYPKILETLESKNIAVWPSEYMSTIYTLSQKYNIEPDSFVRLINRENSKWDKTAKNPKWSSYWLGQMTTSTWNIHGKWLDRQNPHDQLEATAKYLRYILDTKKCSINLAVAFYHTGESFDYQSHDLVTSGIVNNHPGIVRSIPSQNKKNGVSKRDYFISTLARYNDITFNQAEKLI